MKNIGQILIYEPKVGATVDDVMQIFRILMFQTYPASLRTEENLTELYNKLPESAQRHFRIINKTDEL